MLDIAVGSVAACCRGDKLCSRTYRQSIVQTSAVGRWQRRGAEP